ncbi:rhodanese-like domain-containing protein [Methanoculleus taiwanensis]|uniref:rhodanese-like domain-containing protein n=1 Tax=Methanoculleus taiwanensis TaxID=1550565 RepID=UPI0013E8A10F|nr:rhodanese-like domain-containing protein [Methanoculleus taiwanensis]
MVGMKEIVRVAAVLLLLIGLILASGCTEGGLSGGGEGNSGGGEEGVLPVGDEGAGSLAPQEARTFIEMDAPIVVDVRTPAEYAGGHLAGAINIDSSSLGNRIGEMDPNATYLLYCKAGVRSGNALGLMQDAGFTRVYDIEGGITAWKAAGLPVVQG